VSDLVVKISISSIFPLAFATFILVIRLAWRFGRVEQKLEELCSSVEQKRSVDVCDERFGRVMNGLNKLYALVDGQDS